MLPWANDSMLDPVWALECYINRTRSLRSSEGPVFLTLRNLFALSKSASVAKILDEAIQMAGLEGKGFSAKSFRPTRATAAIENHVDPEKVCKVGRWKNSEVFFTHYVHANTPSDFTENFVLYVQK